MLRIIAGESALAAGLALSIGAASGGAPQAVRPDLSMVASGQGWTVVRRAAQSLAEAGRSGVGLDAREGDGIAWLDGSDFDRGVIELDLKGKNVAQQSFLGVAFRGVDDTTYDTVYFRPFNFTAADPARRAHSVQYDSRPDHHWPRLREEHPGVYESAIDPAPDPGAWFHVRIVVDRPEVRVHVNGAEQPCLTVKELSGRAGGRIGLWVGTNSDGLFANLTITAASQDDDARALERAIRDSIGWASNKDRALLESVLARLLVDIHRRPRNGNADIYWVDAGVVTSLRSKAVFR